MRGWQTRPLEIALRVAAALSAAYAVLWVVGINGFGVLFLGSVPDWLERLMFETGTANWSASPTAAAYLAADGDAERLFEFFQDLNGFEDGSLTTPLHWAEILPGTHVQLNDPSLLQRICFLAVQVAILLAVAWIWWTLASLVASGRTATPFTRRNARRLTAIGLVVLLGGTAAALAQWATLTWMIRTSNATVPIGSPGFGIGYVPWWTAWVGASLLVLAAVWRRGVRMEHDVQGLV